MAKKEKLCKHCEKPLTDEQRRRSYHPDCLKLAQEAYQDAKMRCGKCRKTKPGSKFSNDATRANGKFPWCMTCQMEHGTENRFQDPEAELNGNTCPLCDTLIRGHKNRRFCSDRCKNRVAALRKKYNLTVAQFRSMVDATGGRCPICTNRTREWHVDHNHKTRVVTGVVCAKCNVGALASTYHDVAMARRLLDFLEHTPAERLGIDAQVPHEYNVPSSNIHTIWARRGKS